MLQWSLFTPCTANLLQSLGRIPYNISLISSTSHLAGLRHVTQAIPPPSPSQSGTTQASSTSPEIQLSYKVYPLEPKCRGKANNPSVITIVSCHAARPGESVYISEEAQGCMINFPLKYWSEPPEDTANGTETSVWDYTNIRRTTSHDFCAQLTIISNLTREVSELNLTNLKGRLAGCYVEARNKKRGRQGRVIRSSHQLYLGDAKPTKWLASHSAGLGLGLPPKSKPKPKQAILRRRKPFGQAKNVTLALLSFKLRASNAGFQPQTAWTCAKLHVPPSVWAIAASQLSCYAQIARYAAKSSGIEHWEFGVSAVVSISDDVVSDPLAATSV
ncbi:hypothetical protein FB451DRAFT_1172990 [Mycena latifolia]|nr:hypothetical protein FB451DRAFT_1172990 [Mycena latifolia]